MRRKVIDLTKVNLDINIIDLKGKLVRIEYYNTSGDLSKRLCGKKEALKIVKEIKKERSEHWCIVKDKLIYPFRR